MSRHEFGLLIRVAVVLMCIGFILLDVVLSLAQSAPVEPYLLAFVSNRNGNEEIYIMEADGSDLRNVTQNPARDRDPAWSPSGLWLAFLSNRAAIDQAFRMRWDGADVRALMSDVTRNTYDRGFEWSPDGTQLTIDNGVLTLGTYIYRVNATGRERPRLTDYGDGWGADWSLDGQWIAFNSDRSGNYEIYRMGPDGREVINLTNSSGSDWFPRWSPVNNTMVFISTRDGDYELYRMSGDGADVAALTDNRHDDYAPEWSPDGKWIVYVSNQDGNLELYRMSATGGERQRLTFNPAEDRQPTWSPDGEWIAFVSERDGNPEIYRIRAEGSAIERLTDNPAQDTTPAWSPPFRQGWFPGVLSILAVAIAAITTGGLRSQGNGVK